MEIKQKNKKDKNILQEILERIDESHERQEIPKAPLDSSQTGVFPSRSCGYNQQWGTAGAVDTIDSGEQAN